MTGTMGCWILQLCYAICVTTEDIVYLSAEEAYASSSVEVNNFPLQKNKAATMKHNSSV